MLRDYSRAKGLKISFPRKTISRVFKINRGCHLFKIFKTKKPITTSHRAPTHSTAIPSPTSPHTVVILPPGPPRRNPEAIFASSSFTIMASKQLSS